MMYSSLIKVLETMKITCLFLKSWKMVIAWFVLISFWLKCFYKKGKTMLICLSDHNIFLTHHMLKMAQSCQNGTFHEILLHVMTCHVIVMM